MIGALAGAWTALVFLNYVPALRPTFAEMAAGWGGAGLPLPASALAAAVVGHARAALAAVAVLLGLRGAGRVGGRWLGRGSGWLDAVPLGVGLAGGLVMALGLAGLLTGPVAAAVSAGLIAAGTIRRPTRAPAAASVPGWALAAVALAGLAALPGTLAPEVTYDALAYHLGAPAAWLAQHRIVHLERWMFASFPLAPQLAWGLALGCGGGDGAPKFLHWAFGLGTMAATARLGARLAGRAGAGWAAAFAAATTLVTTGMMKANVDLALTWCAASAVYHLMPGTTGRAAVLAGVLAGCAAACKLTGGYAILAGVMALLAVAPRRVGGAALFATGAALPLLPWLARAWLDTGDPVYPFLAPLLGSPEWTAENAAIYRADMTGGTSFNLQYGSLAAAASWPWQAVMHDRGGEAGLGPFVLALAPVLLLLRGAGRAAPAARTGFRRLVVVAMAILGLWVLTARDPRFALPAWPALCALAAAALVALRGRTAGLLRAACAVGVAGSLLLAAALPGRLFAPGPVVWGAVSRDEFLTRMLPPPGRYAPLARAATALTPPGRRVLVVGDVKTALIGREARSQSLFDTPHLVAWARAARDEGRLAVRFRQAGVGTVFYNAGGVTYLHGQFGEYALDARQARVLRGFWAHRLAPLHRLAGEPEMSLWAVRARRGSATGPVPGWPAR